ncbi:MAG: hypothetical protein HY578_06630 [Nitrospinae bacterium]|nr:hypothetical protein [Nitrospinota bacterium]
MAEHNGLSINNIIIKQNLTIRKDAINVEAKRLHNFQSAQKLIKGDIKEKTIKITYGVEKGKKINTYI